MQSMHCLAMPMPRAMSSFVFTSRSPSAMAAWCSAVKPFAVSGASPRNVSRLELLSAMVVFQFIEISRGRLPADLDQRARGGLERGQLPLRASRYLFLTRHGVRDRVVVDEVPRKP